MMMHCSRAVILPLIAFNAVFNVYALYRIQNFKSNLNGDAESEWEGAGQHIIRMLATVSIFYVLLSSTASAIGIHGVYKRIPSSVRIYLQFAFADFVAAALLLVGSAFGCYSSPRWRDVLCEEISTHADMLRALQRSGFDIDACERWIAKFVAGVFWFAGLLLVLKLQFTLAVASYYTSLAKATGEPTSVFTSSSSAAVSRRRGSVRSRSSSQRSHRELDTLPKAGRSQTADLPPYSDGTPNPSSILASGALEAPVILVSEATPTLGSQPHDAAPWTPMDLKKRA